MSRIQLLPIGKADLSSLGSLGTALTAEFGVPCEIVAGGLDPAPSLHPERRQYYSSDILSRMQEQLASNPGRLLGVTPLDLYIPILTFVFGEAQLDGSCAVVSTHRLRQEFYGLPPDQELLQARLVKESVHELGHTFGLTHCDNYRCAMAASHTVELIDLKSNSLCTDCRARSLAGLSRSSIEAS
ncbi:MAG TPA: archaemetzincin family Zn-dependent metalloprotease [Terriglobia bacterium]|nr:archaemetzincin family Zn-dependent metalloprotease [Terriglobia bacterium]